MYSNEDFKQLFIQYKGEVYGRGESIQTFCHKHNVPYNLFQKWYKDTRYRVEEVEVTVRPSTSEPAEEPVPASQTAQSSGKAVHILMDLRMSNGLHVRQGNLS